MWMHVCFQWHMWEGKERDLGISSENHCTEPCSTNSSCSQPGSWQHLPHWQKSANNFHILDGDYSFFSVTCEDAHLAIKWCQSHSDALQYKEHTQTASAAKGKHYKDLRIRIWQLSISSERLTTCSQLCFNTLAINSFL